jgi:G:T-mismatch repair DNA endonuclease (very short patch repair protein)/transposase-like protein
MNLINEIFINGNKILEFKKEGKNNYAILSNNNIIGSSKIKTINIICNKCKSENFINYRRILNDQLYICQSCNKIGNKNPFFNRTCSEHTKHQISKANKNNKYWVGKTHSKETKEKISKSVSIAISGKDNPFFGKTHSEKSRKQLSNSLKIWASLNKDHYRKMGINSCMKQSLGKKNIPEKIVEEFLKENNIEYVYSKKIQNRQFDFYLNEYNLLLEVHGDYWHANPKIYGENKRQINEIQLMKISNDKQKKKLAESLGYKLKVIWEQDIKSNKFRSSLLKYLKGKNVNKI